MKHRILVKLDIPTAVTNIHGTHPGTLYFSHINTGWAKVAIFTE